MKERQLSPPKGIALSVTRSSFDLKAQKTKTGWQTKSLPPRFRFCSGEPFQQPEQDMPDIRTKSEKCKRVYTVYRVQVFNLFIDFVILVVYRQIVWCIHFLYSYPFNIRINQTSQHALYHCMEDSLNVE